MKLKTSMNYTEFESTHDLSLPDWGPYSPKFFGLSHIADKKKGVRFDFVVGIALNHERMGLPHIDSIVDFQPWQASPELDFYTYRQQLEWKDKVFCDISFQKNGESVYLVSCRMVNNSNHPVSLTPHLLSILSFPFPERVEPEGVIDWLVPRLEIEKSGLVYDALHPREIRSAEGVKESIYQVFAGESLSFIIPDNWNNKKFFLRCKPIDGDWTTVELDSPFSYTAETDQFIDGLAVTNGNLPVFKTLTNNTAPELIYSSKTAKAEIKYPSVKRKYLVSPLFEVSFVRRYKVPDLAASFKNSAYVYHPHFQDILIEHGTEHAADIAGKPFLLQPGEEKSVTATVSEGECPVAKTTPSQKNILPESTYKACMERTAATLFTNIIFPVRLGDSYVRHHVPGRKWNSLYTWDAGFIGLGLLEFSVKRAIENLNSYLTTANNQENAFIHHGTPLPVQIYLYNEIWTRTLNKDFLTTFYPRVKQFYEYFVGHHPKSRFRPYKKCPLLYPWEYSYNSGGWDDYPPQWDIYLNDRKHIFPVATTAHAIRCAKILKYAAIELGFETKTYDRDIIVFEQALSEYAWDEESGYFGYVKLNDELKADNIWRAADNSNYNKGLDGITPLIADSVSEKQKKNLWNKLRSPVHCWSDKGLSTVDQSASYYKNDGYWNGTVWMPHQWFFWKAALNDGDGDFAWKIASTALNVWKSENEYSYGCFEHFAIDSGRGGGWRHFSGLSTPVLCWNNAYYKPGNLTLGFDVFPHEYCINDKYFEIKLSIFGRENENTVILYCAALSSAEYNGNSCPCKLRHNGMTEIILPKNTSGTLRLIY